MMNPPHANLVCLIWPETKNNVLRNVVLAVAGSVVVAVAAQINVPMIPVPMTLQTLAVLAIGMSYGARLGAATLTLYMLEGMAGLPVFAQMKSGVATVMGPSLRYHRDRQHQLAIQEPQLINIPTGALRRCVALRLTASRIASGRLPHTPHKGVTIGREMGVTVQSELTWVSYKSIFAHYNDVRGMAAVRK
jgi:BioY family